MNDIEIKIVDHAEEESILRLYRDAGWWKPEYDRAFLKSIPDSSFCFAGALLGSGMIGMGRALSDGVSDAYIQDVTVLKEYRGMGIGTKIVMELIRHLKEHGVDWIGLIAEPGSAGFYERLGFSPMSAYVPMLLKGKINLE